MKVLSLLAAFAWISASFLLAANTTSRERLLMDFGWRFHLGDAPDAGDQFYYPEFARLDKIVPTTMRRKPGTRRCAWMRRR